MTNTYAIIDDYSGFVWGVAEAEDPVAACKKIDEELFEFGRTYEEVSRFSHHGAGYHVYEAPNGFTVNDGQSADEIAAVEAMPKAGCVAIYMGEI